MTELQLARGATRWLRKFGFLVSGLFLLVVLAVNFVSGAASSSNASNSTVDYAASFNGTNQFFSGANFAALPTTGDFTFQAWVREEEGTTGWRGIFGLGASADSNERFLAALGGSASDRRVEVYFRGGGSATSAIRVPQGEWVHISVTHDAGTNYKVFINGQLASTLNHTSTAAIKTSVVTIGRNYYGADSFFKGEIDEVRTWNRILSDTEISTNMHQRVGGDSSGLLYYWDFNEGGTGNTFDAKSNQQLTNQGSATRVDVKQVSYLTGGDTVLTFPRTYLPGVGGWTVPQNSANVQALVVAGGGGGGGDEGGGGGAGGLTVSSLVPVASSTLSVVVGMGGFGANNEVKPANNGQDSVFGQISTLGGGAGGDALNTRNSTVRDGSDGGSGGGGAGEGSSYTIADAGSGTPGQGNDGSVGFNTWGGGGGGAGAAAVQNAGGSGKAVSILTSTVAQELGLGEISSGSVYFAGGGGAGAGNDGSRGLGGLGGGGDGNTSALGTQAIPNSGGGGGGGGTRATGTTYGVAYSGNSGASGVVIVRYAPTQDLAWDKTGASQNFASVNKQIVPTSGSWTFESWVYANPAIFTDGALNGIFSQQNDSDSEGNRAGLWVADTGALAYNHGGTQFDVSNFILQADRWYHVALTSTGTQVKLFVDGTEVYALTHTRGSVGSNFTLGGLRQSDYLDWAGQLDQVKVWNLALSSTQLQASMHTYSLSGISGVAGTNLLAHYDFNEWDPNQITDRSGNGNHLAYNTAVAGSYLDANFTSSEIVETGTAFGEQTYAKFKRTYLTATGGWQVPVGVERFKSLVVGGGGGGGAWVGGGGGAGGFVERSNLQLDSAYIPIQVGQGGMGARTDGSPYYSVSGIAKNLGSNGQDSKLGSNLTASGGGRGGSHNNGITIQEASPTSGGSGGGGTGRATSAYGAATGAGGAPDQGNAGGDGAASSYVAGGGGGASESGGTATSATGGVGGDGKPTSITGATVILAGGGGGANFASSVNSSPTQGLGGSGGGGNAARPSGQSGDVNSGGGGGGGANDQGSISYGGSGGSGVVILSWGPYLEVTSSPAAARVGEEFTNPIKIQLTDLDGEVFVSTSPVTLTASAGVLTLNGEVLTQSLTVNAVGGIVTFEGLGFAASVTGAQTLTFTSDAFVGTSLRITPSFYPQNVNITTAGPTQGVFVEGEFYATSATGTTTISASDLVRHLASYSTVISASGNISVENSFNSGSYSDIVLRAAGYVELKANAQIRTDGGDIVLWADSDNGSGGFIRMLDNSELCTTAGTCNSTDTGGGNIVLGGGLPDPDNPLRPGGYAKGSGSSYNNSGTSDTTGVQLGKLDGPGTGPQLYSAGGDITIRGQMVQGQTSTNAWMAGVAVVGGTEIRSGIGKILISGEAKDRGGTGASGTIEFNAWGGVVNIQSKSTASDAIVFEGRENTSDVTGSGLWGTNNNTTVTSSGGLVIRANYINAGLDLNLDVTGELVIESYDAGLRHGKTATLYNFQVGGDDDIKLLRSPSGLRIGSATNSNEIELPSNLTIAGPIEVYADDIDVYNNITIQSTSQSARILLKARDWIDVRVGSSSSTFNKLQTNNGDIILWSDSDGNGNGSIYLGSHAELNSANGDKSKTRSGGGRITLAGGDSGVDAEGHPLGYVADTGLNNTSAANFALVLTGTSSIYSGGGDVTMRARSDNNSADAAHIYAGHRTWAGTGQITLDFVHTGTEGASRLEGEWISAAADAPAISISASRGSNAPALTNADGSRLSLISTNPAGGGISVSAIVAAANSDGVDWHEVDLLSAAGSINVTTNGQLLWDDGQARNLGAKASSDVVASAATVSIVAQALEGTTDNASALISTSGTVSILPFGDAFNADSELEFRVESGEFTVGKIASVNSASNTKNFKISRDITAAGPITIASHGITVARGADLISTLAGAEVMLKAKGWIDVVNLTTTNVQNDDAQHSVIQTNNGDIVFWADSDANEQGLIWIAHNTRINSANGVYSYGDVTGGGDIILAGGADDGNGRPAGFAWDSGYRSESVATDMAVGFGKFVDVFTGGGNLTIRAKAKNTGLSAFHFQSQAEFVTGQGQIIIDAQATSDMEAFEYFITDEAQAGALFSSYATSTPAISISASLTNVNNQAMRVYTLNSTPTTFQSLSTTGGGVAFSAMLGQTTTNIGAYLGSLNVLSRNGAITYSSNALVDLSLSGQNQRWGGASGTDVPTSSAPLTFKVNDFDRSSNNRNIQISTSGAVSLLPWASNFGKTTATYWYPTVVDAGSFTVGDSASATTSTLWFEIYGTINSRGPIQIFANRMSLRDNKDLLTSASGAGITLKAKDSIYIDPGTSDADANQSRIRTNNGDIIIWGDSDGDGSGSVALEDFTDLNSANGVESTSGGSGGGAIIIAGGSASDANGYPTGNLGINDWFYTDRALTLGNSLDIFSGGGDVAIRGMTNQLYGIVVWNNIEIFSGEGTIEIFGETTGTADNYRGISFIDWGSENAPLTIVSHASQSPAIQITGNSASTLGEGLRLYGEKSNQVITIASPSPVGGGVSISARTAWVSGTAVYFGRAKILSQAGPITVSGGSRMISFDPGTVDNNIFGSHQGSPYVTTSSAAITFTSDLFDFDRTGSTTYNTSGIVSFVPFTNNAFGAELDFRHNLTNTGGLVIGKPPLVGDAEQIINVRASQSVSGEIKVYGGNIRVGDTGAANLNASATISLIANASIQIYDRTLTTQGSAIWLQARANGGSQGGIYVRTSNFSTNGGLFLASGGANPFVDYAVGTHPWSGYIGVSLESATQVNTAGGDVVIRGSQGPQNDPDDGAGVFLSNSTINAGAGDISILGRLVDQPWTNADHEHSGILTYGASITTTTGDMELIGDGTAVSGNKDDKRGQLLWPATITTTDGDITISGTVNSSAGDSFDLQIWVGDNGSTIRSTNGNVAIVGQGSSRVLTNTSYFQAGKNLLVRDDSPLLQSTTLTGSAVVTIEPFGSSFSTNPDLTTTTFAASLSGFRLGKESNELDLTHAKQVTVNGPIEILAGAISLQAAQETTSSSARVLLKSKASIVANASGDITTNGGDLILWSNADGDTTSTGRIELPDGVALSSNGGNIVLAGGASADSNGYPAGYSQPQNSTGAAGINLGADLVSAGGDILIRGSLASGAGANNSFGIYTTATALLDSGAGSITVNGIHPATDGQTGNYYAAWLGGELRTTTGNISVSADVSAHTANRANRYGLIVYGVQIISSQGGDIQIDAKSTIANGQDIYQWNNLGGMTVSTSGSITITGRTGNGISLAGSDVSSGELLTIKTDRFTGGSNGDITGGDIIIDRVSALSTNANFDNLYVRVGNATNNLTIGSQGVSSVTMRTAVTVQGSIELRAQMLAPLANLVANGAGGHIKLQADSIDGRNFSQTYSSNNDGRVIFSTNTNGRSLVLAGTTASPALTISATTLQASRTDVLQVGDNNSGDIFLAGDLTLTSPNVGAFRLSTPGSVTSLGASVIQAPNLAIDAGGNVNLPGQNSVPGSVAISGSGTVSYASAASYSPAVVDGIPAVFGVGTAVSQTNSPAVQNRNAFLAVTFNPPPQFVVTDFYGQTLDGNNRLAASYTVSATVATGSGTVVGLTASRSGDVYGFNSLRIDSNPGTYSFTITVDDGASGFTTNSIEYTVLAGDPATLDVTPIDSTAPAGQASLSYTVAVKDSAGNPITAGTNANVTVSASISGTTAVLVSGSQAQADNTGVATFNNLLITGSVSDTISISFWVEFTNNQNVYTTVSSEVYSITLTPGTPTQLAIDSSDQTKANRSTLSAVVISLLDDYGNVVENRSDQITVSVGAGSGANLVGTNQLSFTAGAGSAASVTFDDIALQGTVGDYRLDFESNQSGISSVSHDVTLVHGAPAAISVSRLATAARSGIAFGTQPVIKLLDLDDNLVPSEASVSAAVAGATLSGTDLIAMIDGIATFSNLVLTGPASDYTIDYEITQPVGLASFSTFQTLQLTAGNAAKLAVVQQPQDVVAGVSQAVSVSVQVVDAQDNPTTVTQTTTIEVELLDYGQGRAVVQTSSNLVLSPGAGTATISNLAFTKAVQTAELRFSSSGLVAAVSNLFRIAPAAAEKLVWVQDLSSATNDVVITPNPSVRILDAFDNPVIQTSGQTTVSVSVIVGDANVLDLSGAQEQSDNSSSLVTFDALKLRAKVGTYQLRFTAIDPGDPIDGFDLDSSTFTLGFGAADALTVSPATLAIANRDTVPDLTVSVLDTAGNLVADSSVAITPGVIGATLSSTAAVNAVSGQATFSALTFTAVSGNYDLGFSSGSLTNATTSIAVSHGPAHSIELSTPATGRNALTLSEMVVTIYDEEGNVVDTGGQSTQNVVLSATGATISGTTTVAALDGVATFSNVALTGLIGQKTITATIQSPQAINISEVIELTFGNPYELELTQAASGFVNRELFAVTPEVTVRDVSGNVVSASGMVIRATVAGLTLSGTVTAAADTGIAVFASDLVLSGVVGDYQIVYTAEGTSASGVIVATQDISLLHGSASQLVITQAAADALAGKNFETQPIVELQDPDGNRVSSSDEATSSVRVRHLGNPWNSGPKTGRTLEGTNAISLSAGIGTFAGLKLIGEAGAINLTYEWLSDTNVSVSQSINLEPGDATNLSVVTQPQDVVAGVAFASDLEVEFLDAYSNRVTRLTQSATVQAKLIDSATSLTKETSVAFGASSGLVTFTGLNFTKAGLSGITFEPHADSSVSGVIAANSNQFTVSPAAGDSIEFMVTPQSTTTNDTTLAGVGAAYPKLRVLDAFGNTVSNAVTTISVSVTPTPTAISGNQVTTTDGTALFNALVIKATSGSYDLEFAAEDANGVFATLSHTVTINPGIPTQLAITQQSATARAGQNLLLQPILEIRDSAGNVVGNSSLTVSLAVTGATLVGANEKQAASGIANFAGISLTGSASDVVTMSYQIEYGGNTISVSQAIQLLAGDVHSASLSWTVTDVQTRVAPQNNPVVTLFDEFGNQVLSDNSTTMEVGLYRSGSLLTVSPVSYVAVGGEYDLGSLTFKATPNTGYYYQFEVAGISAISSSPFTMLPGPVAKVHIHQQPSTVVGSSLTMTGEIFAQVAIAHLLDQDDNLVTTVDSGDITAAISSGSGGSLISASASISNGVATFTNLKLVGVVAIPGLNQQAEDYRLTFGYGGFDSPESNILNVKHNLASQITVVQAAAGGRSGMGFTTPPRIRLLDRYGNWAHSGMGVTVEIRVFDESGATTPTIATITGVTRTTSNGEAEFGVGINGLVDKSFRLSFEANTDQGVPITSAEQTGVTITHGEAYKQVIIREVASDDGSGNLTKIGSPLYTQPVIEIQDVNDNRVLDFNGVVIASFSSVARGERDYLIANTVSAVAGVATFSGLAVVGEVGSSYKLNFFRQGSGSNPDESAPFVLTHGDAEYLTIEDQPLGGNKTGDPLNQSPRIAVRDFDGNITTTLNGSSVSAAVVVGGGSVDTSGSNTDKALVTNGIAQFSNLTVVALPGVEQRLQFTLDGAANSASGAVVSTQSATFSLIVSDAYQLSVFTQPCTAADCSAGPTADLLGVQPVVEIQDRFGNRATQFNGIVTVTAQGTGGYLRDADDRVASVTVSAVSGLATFSNLRLEGTPGTNYTLEFSSGALVPTSSEQIQVIHTTPSQLVITTQPVGDVTGELLGVQPVLEVRDRFGNKAVTDNSTNVTVSILSGPNRLGGVAPEITGSLTVTAVNGVVTFSDLDLTGLTGANYVLRFDAAGFGVNSQAVVLSAANAMSLEWVTQPVALRTGEAMPTQPVLRLLDFDGNLASSTAATVTVTVSGGGYIEAGTTSSAVDGVVTFSGLTLVAAPNTNQTLTFTATTAGGSFSVNTTNPLSVEHTAASKMTIDTAYATSAEQGRVLGTQPIIRLFDRFDNPAVNDNTTVVTATIGSGAGGAISGSATATAVGGVVTFAGLAVTGSPGVAYTIDFSAGGYGVAGTAQLRLFKTAALEVSYSNMVFSSSPTTSPAIAFTDSTENSITFSAVTTQFCTVNASSGEVNVLGAGTCVIRAEVAEGTYYKAKSLETSFVIAKADQDPVVITSNAYVDFGQVLTLTSSGGSSTGNTLFGANGQCQILGDKLMLFGNATEDLTPTCRIIASRPGDANYKSSSTEWMDIEVRRIAQASITIGNSTNVSVGDVELFILGGSGNGVISYTVSPGVNYAGCSVTDGILSATTNGTCEVTAQKSQSMNYNVATSPAKTFTFQKELQRVTITSAPPSMPLPGQTYRVTATASSGLSISYAITKGQEIQETQFASYSAPVCALSQSVSGQVTFLRSGECEVTATQAGNGRFAQASEKISILVGQLNQFITFDPIADRTYGAPAFRLSAVASSNLPVSFTISAGVNVCSISNGMVNINAAGTCEIRASQAGNGTYAPAPNVTRTFVVNPDLASSPVLVSAAVGNQWFTVGYTAPSYTGGANIIGYRLEVRDQNSNVYVNSSCPVSAPLTCTLAGLPNDVSYTARIAAITAAGVGQYSNNSMPLTPSPAAMSVTQLSADTSNDGLELSWIPPVALEGTFQRYEVYAWVTGTEEPVSPTTILNTSASDEVTIAISSISSAVSISPASYQEPQLQIIQPLYMTSRGIHIFGVARTKPMGFIALASIAQQSTESATVGYTMRVVTITDTRSSSQVINSANGMKVGLSAPSAPTQLSLDTSDESKIVVSWAAPSSDGGFPLIDYQVTSNGQVICANIQTRVCEVSPLTDSTTYNIEVKARNALGMGDAAGASHTTPTPPPVVLNSLQVNQELQLAVSRIPQMTAFAPQIARPGSIVTITGSRLDIIRSLSLAGLPVEYLALSDTELRFMVPASTAPGIYSLVHTSEFGTVTVMDALRVSGLPVEESLQPVVPEEPTDPSPDVDTPVNPEVSPAPSPTDAAPVLPETTPESPAPAQGGSQEQAPKPTPTETGVDEPSEPSPQPSVTAQPQEQGPSESVIADGPRSSAQPALEIWFLLALLFAALLIGLIPRFRSEGDRG